MVALGGSAALGVSDAYSDIDVLVWWDGAIDAAWVETAPLAGEGAARFTHMPLEDGVLLEQYLQQGLKVDVGHLTLAWWEQEVAAVLDGHDLDPGRHEMLGGFLDALPLHGAQAYAAWRERIAAYPDGLAGAVVAHHVATGFPPLLLYDQQGLGRGDRLTYYDAAVATIKSVLGVLGGLNGLYLSTAHPKHVDVLVGRMAIRPDDLERGIEAALDGDAARLAALGCEVLDLVERHRPEVDTGGARLRLTFTVDPWP
jgi:hypothetical protein